MADTGGGCGKCILALLSAIFEMVGFTFLGISLYLKVENDSNEKRKEETFIWLMIIHGALEVIVGAAGLCCVCRKSRSGLKAFCVVLALLALADILTGMVVHFKCKEDTKEGCPYLEKVFSNSSGRISPSVIMGVFLGNAVLLIASVVCSTCLLKQTRRINVEMSARFTTKI